MSVGVDRHGDYRGDGDDPPALAHLKIGRVEPQVGPVADDRPVEELPDTIVDVLAQLRHRAFGDAGKPHGLHKLVDPAGGDAADPSLLDHRDQGLLRRPARLQEAREVGTLPQLRHPQVQCAEPRLQLAVAIAVAPGLAAVAALVAAGANYALDVVLHQQLQHRLGDGA